MRETLFRVPVVDITKRTTDFFSLVPDGPIDVFNYMGLTFESREPEIHKIPKRISTPRSGKSTPRDNSTPRDTRPVEWIITRDGDPSNPGTPEG